MRTNIDIDDTLMNSAMRAGPYSTKREAVEAGLQLLARKAAYRDILALRGQLQWDDGPAAQTVTTTALAVHSPPPPPYVTHATQATAATTAAPPKVITIPVGTQKSRGK
jgi:antitoxin ParD1/3/4